MMSESIEMLPLAELREVMASAARADRFIGGTVAGAVVCLYRGNLERLEVPCRWFEKRPGATADFSDFAITDYGQSVRLGAYEAATDAILYQFDEAYRQRAEARREGDT